MASHLGLRSLTISHLWDARLKWVKQKQQKMNKERKRKRKKRKKEEKLIYGDYWSVGFLLDASIYIAYILDHTSSPSCQKAADSVQTVIIPPAKQPSQCPTSNQDISEVCAIHRHRHRWDFCFILLHVVFFFFFLSFFHFSMMVRFLNACGPHWHRAIYFFRATVTLD